MIVGCNLPEYGTLIPWIEPQGSRESAQDVRVKRAHARFEGAELTTGLRKMLEAKDCMVRAAL